MGCTPSTQAVRSGSASPQERMVGAAKPPPKVQTNIAQLPSESAAKKNGVDHKKAEDKIDEHKKEKKKKKKKHSAGSHGSRKSSSSSSSCKYGLVVCLK